MSEPMSRVSMVFEAKPPLWLRVRIMAEFTKSGISYYYWNEERTELTLWVRSEEIDQVIKRITEMQKARN